MHSAPQAPPYRPEPRPHLGRTAVLLALIGAALLAVVCIAWEVGDDGVVIPQEELVRPYQLEPDPGLYTPFTYPPVAGR